MRTILIVIGVLALVLGNVAGDGRGHRHNSGAARGGRAGRFQGQQQRSNVRGRSGRQQGRRGRDGSGYAAPAADDYAAAGADDAYASPAGDSYGAADVAAYDDSYDAAGGAAYDDYNYDYAEDTAAAAGNAYGAPPAAADSYGAPPASADDSYGGPVAADDAYGAPGGDAAYDDAAYDDSDYLGDSYSEPSADSYGSPAADDSYGAPAGADDSYGAPADYSDIPNDTYAAASPVEEAASGYDAARGGRSRPGFGRAGRGRSLANSRGRTGRNQRNRRPSAGRQQQQARPAAGAGRRPSQAGRIGRGGRSLIPIPVPFRGPARNRLIQQQSRG